MNQNPELNLKQVKVIEDEIKSFQQMEINIQEDNKAMRAIMAKYPASSLYSDSKKLEKMIAEIDDMIADLASTAATRGKLMSLATMENYLDKAEKKMTKMRNLDAIARANTQAEKKRLELYMLESLKEKNILKADIDIYKATARLAGKSERNILKDLTAIADDEQGPLYAYEKRMKSLQVAVARREEQASELAEYEKYQIPGAKWQWITISVNPCPDCRIRAGIILSWDDWEARGLPGSGRTICREFCLCKLYPEIIADELFPDVKQFRWDKGSGVLATAGDERTFAAKKNQPN